MEEYIKLSEWLNGREKTPELLIEYMTHLKNLGREKVYPVEDNKKLKEKV